MTKIYSYVLKFDEGAAPNPFWGVCTLTICKPVIRRNAKIGDWVIGTGSKKSKLKDGIKYDLSHSLVYAMKITDIKTLKEYDEYCNCSLKNKIPKWKTKDWRQRVGDCIYDYSKENKPTIRKSVHNESNRKTDLGGENALLSNKYYYFGTQARPLPAELRKLIKKNQGHRKIENIDLIKDFESWIAQFKKNKIYAEPQMCWLFDREMTKIELLSCAKQHLSNDKNGTEETVY